MNSLEELRSVISDIVFDAGTLADSLNDLSYAFDNYTANTDHDEPFITLNERETETIFDTVKASGNKEAIDILDMKIWKATRR